MAVPSQAALHRPILETLAEAGSDGVSVADLRRTLIQRLEVSDVDLAERVPTGRQTKFDNRVDWANSYLRRAGLLETPSRGRRQITEGGRDLLKTHSGDIGNAQLKGLFDQPASTDGAEDKDAGGGTPEEQIASLHRDLETKLADELLERVRRVSPDDFESLVVKLLERMGYGKGERVGRPGDGGIDGVIDQDVLGLEKVYVQAKRQRDPVNEPAIRQFVGSLQPKRAGKGVFITASRFGPKAREAARDSSDRSQSIRLIDGEELAQLMIAHGVGVVVETTYEVKKVDENYFVEEDAAG